MKIYSAEQRKSPYFCPVCDKPHPVPSMVTWCLEHATEPDKTSE